MRPPELALRICCTRHRSGATASTESTEFLNGSWNVCALGKDQIDIAINTPAGNAQIVDTITDGPAPGQQRDAHIDRNHRLHCLFVLQFHAYLWGNTCVCADTLHDTSHMAGFS